MIPQCKQYQKKVSGKGLSTNDFTNELKEKLNKLSKREILTAKLNKKTWTVSGSWSNTHLLPFNSSTHSHISEEKLTLTDAGIKVGSGISKVLVSATFNGIQFSKFSGDIYCDIVVFSGSTEKAFIQSYNTNFAITFASVCITPTILEVSENDLIFLRFGCGGGGAGEIQGAYLTVEVLE